MKKSIILFIFLFLVTPSLTNAQVTLKVRATEQTILNEVKSSEKIKLSEKILEKAINNTKSELMSLRREVIAKGYKVTHVCYPNGVIKQISIYTVDSVLNRYFDAYGKPIGDIEYYYKDNVLADAHIYPYSSLAQTSGSNKTQTNKISKIQRIGDMFVTYNGDKIQRIGDMFVTYNGDKIQRIDDMNVSY